MELRMFDLSSYIFFDTLVSDRITGPHLPDLVDSDNDYLTKSMIWFIYGSTTLRSKGLLRVQFTESRILNGNLF